MVASGFLRLRSTLKSYLPHVLILMMLLAANGIVDRILTQRAMDSQLKASQNQPSESFKSIELDGAGIVPEEMRIGFMPNLTHPQALLGLGTDAFHLALSDVDVTMKAFKAGPDMLESLFSEQIDIGYIGPVPAINGYTQSGGDLVIIAGAASGGTTLVAGAGTGIASPADLSGRRVAVPQFGNTQDLLLRQILQSHGLAPVQQGGTVDLVQATGADVLGLLERGAIDAALMPEPWGTRAVVEASAQLVLDESALAFNGDYPVTVVVVRRSFLERYPETVSAFLTVHKTLTETLQTNPTTSYTTVRDQLSKLTGASLTESIFSQAIERITPTDLLNQEALKLFFDLSQTTGFSAKTAKLEGIWRGSLAE